VSQKKKLLLAMITLGCTFAARSAGMSAVVVGFLSIATLILSLSAIFHRRSPIIGLCAGGCGRQMQVIGLGQAGGVGMTRQEMLAGVGGAEQCRECGRLFCDICYPQRERNSCPCGKGQTKVYHERGAVHRGSIRLVKVRYL